MTQPEPAIGEIVRWNIQQVLQHCEVSDHSELERLLDRDYSKRTFGLTFPFCKVAGDIVPGTGDHARYWAQIYTVRGIQLRVTSQWFVRNRDGFLAYLAEKAIIPVLAAEDTPEAFPVVLKRAMPKGRFRSHAIGNAQNSFIRTLLSSLGDEAFSTKDWNETKAHFDDRCAYCGSADDLVMDHAVPINRVSLGEHRLGNLVPACHGCNSAKGNKDFREFPGATLEAVAKIESFMDSRDYVPLGDNAQIRLFLETAYDEVGSLAGRYITLINSFFPRTASAVIEPDEDASIAIPLA